MRSNWGRLLVVFIILGAILILPAQINQILQLASHKCDLLWTPLVDDLDLRFYINIFLPHVDPFVMVWLMILRDMFSLSWYYLMWIDIDFFCAYTYVADHLVASLVWGRWCFIIVNGNLTIGLLKTFLLSSIMKIIIKVFFLQMYWNEFWWMWHTKYNTHGFFFSL